MPRTFGGECTVIPDKQVWAGQREAFRGIGF
jgi:hypothetical protein